MPHIATIDVRPLLTAPDDPTKAHVTTQEIDDLSHELLALDGGGTMFFSAGDYCIQHLAETDPAYRGGVPLPGIVDHWHQGGIRIRPRINLVGEGGTRLVWCDGIPEYAIPPATEPAFHPVPASFMGGGTPFVWDPELGVAGDFVQAVMINPLPEDDPVGDVRAGDVVFTVDTIDGFDEGTPVVIRLDVQVEDTEPPLDNPEVKWWTFANVVDVDPGDPEADPPVPATIELDRPAQIPCEISAQEDLRSHVIMKVDPDRRVDGIEIRNFEMVLASAADQEGTLFQWSEGGLVLRYARNCLIENLISTDVGAGIVAVQYSQNVAVNRVHVRSASVFPPPATPPANNDYYGRGLALQAVDGCTVSDLRVEHFQSDAILLEQHCIQARFRNVYLVNNHPNRNQTGYGMVTSIQRSDAALDGLTVEGVSGFSLFKFDGPATIPNRQVTVTDLTLRPVSRGRSGSPQPDPAAVQTRFLRGGVRRDRVIGNRDGSKRVVYYFDQPRTWSKAVQIPSPGLVDVTLPDGLLHRGRLYVSCVPTDLDELRLVNGVEPYVLDIKNLNPPILLPGLACELPLQATTLGPAVPGGNFVAEQLVDGDTAEPLARFLRIDNGGAGVPPGEFLVVQVQYFPYRNPDNPTFFGSRDDRDGGFVQGVDPLQVSLRVDGSDHSGTNIQLDADDEDWHDIEFQTPGPSPVTRYVEASLRAAPGDLVRFAPSFTVGGDFDTDVSFDVRCVAPSGKRWSASTNAQDGFTGWRAEVREAVGKHRTVTGGVTYRVQATDLVDEYLTLRMQYRLEDADGGTNKRTVIATDTRPAYVEVVNVSVP